jgi:hypothetical protein
MPEMLSYTSRTLTYAFHDGVSDIKMVEEIAMKKPKMVADLLTVTDVCIEASEARAQFLESCGKGSMKKQDDREVNKTYRGDHRYHGKQSSDQKGKRPFRCPNDAENWCKIHHTIGHDLGECRTFLDHKKMLPPVVPAPQEPRHGDHRWIDLGSDE